MPVLPTSFHTTDLAPWNRRNSYYREVGQASSICQPALHFRAFVCNQFPSRDRAATAPVLKEVDCIKWLTKGPDGPFTGPSLKFMSVLTKQQHENAWNKISY